MAFGLSTTTKCLFFTLEPLSYTVDIALILISWIGNDSFDPKCITDRKLMKEYAPEYLYFEAIAYIQSVRTWRQSEM